MDKNDAAICQYLVEELKMPPAHIANTLDLLKKQADIYAEFVAWLEAREFPEHGIIVEGYSASKIAQIQPKLSGLAVYLLLAELRSDTERALGYLKEGLKIE